MCFFIHHQIPYLKGNLKGLFHLGLDDFPQAIDDAVMDSNESHQEMMMQYLSNPELAKGFARVVFDMLNGS